MVSREGLYVLRFCFITRNFSLRRFDRVISRPSDLIKKFKKLKMEKISPSRLEAQKAQARSSCRARDLSAQQFFTLINCFPPEQKLCLIFRPFVVAENNSGQKK